MPIITWSDEYDVNVEEIDNQHKKLLDNVNNFHYSVENCIDKQDLERLLIQLIEYTRLHFSTEEQLIKKYDYPVLLKHQNEHKILLSHLDNLADAV